MLKILPLAQKLHRLESMLLNLPRLKPRSVAERKTAKVNLRWTRKSRSKCGAAHAADLLKLDTPVQFFFHVFTQDQMKRISEETNFYEVQKDPNSTFRVSETDVKLFIGVAYLMSLIQSPRVINDWSPTLGTLLVQEIMTLNKVEKIRQTLHFNDNNKSLIWAPHLTSS
ncbi:hypothetical protein EVAR_36708_1 [Eumeta japonica]|uniref:PiggyBac transposable element-derived protein domain-containing protein n=1 Tax=Eumeta variegata TaxID=151549 RepID=A0A4C1XNE6_EUMVA|nr:hypothetical protein EVAR_36708_1 [Eumeta japonica]